MQGDRFAAGNLLVLFPDPQAGTIAAGCKQPVQHGQKQNPLDRQRQPAAGQQTSDHLRDLQFFPKPCKDDRRSDSPRGDDGRFPLAMRGEHHHRLGELRARLQQGIELPTFAEPVESPQRGDHPLLASSLFPTIFNDLQIHALPGLLLTEKHGGLHAELLCSTMNISIYLTMSMCKTQTWHHESVPNPALLPKAKDLRPKINVNCRKRVKPGPTGKPHAPAECRGGSGRVK